MSKNKPSLTIDDPIEVQIIFRNGIVRDVPNLLAGISVQVYDYDLDKYPKDRLEPDPEDKPCVATIWTHYPVQNGKTIQVIRYTVRIGVRKRKVDVDECPDVIKVTVITEERKKK